ncbi:hypothetical protein A1OE_1061 [Candidatus Endolissoclinum faulkneri L2]|uniref:Uncharacterized protein n=1 Tax=Candidatus Endolissoclinum faulkneri L2 TaxID=1193729 RepID=K7YRR1_9PROT|nr:hypothetical protein A1OE_1061 [Candidatus Endolissoclinum faulkneri L2]
MDFNRILKETCLKSTLFIILLQNIYFFLFLCTSAYGKYNKIRR